MKKLKLFWVILPLVAVLLIFVPLSIDKDIESEITAFVISNQEDLLEVSLQHLDGDTALQTFKTAKIDGVFGDEQLIVQFSQSTAGIAPSSRYFGFYYSVDNLPVAFQGAPNPLIRVSDEVWEWSDEADNGGITKKILENWYYYEAWF